MSDALLPRLTPAIEARAAWFEGPHESAFRLFNGFTEGFPALALDVFGTTLVVHDYADSPIGAREVVDEAVGVVMKRLPFLKVAVWKIRHASAPDVRAGEVIVGDEGDLTRRVKEQGVSYSLNVRLNRDTSLYLDTRSLRTWAKAELNDARVLNAFAYTGSLGVAAKAGGARHVIHTDLNKAFLTAAKDSYSMNGWPIARGDFKAGDFFDVMGQLKRDELVFDAVFIDPPYFSRTDQGVVDVQNELKRLINKVRPLVAHEGRLIIVNNALFVSGADFTATLEQLCEGGFLSIERRVDVDDDFAGYPSTRQPNWPADPAPFNHSTKIAVLRTKRKDERK